MLNWWLKPPVGFMSASFLSVVLGVAVSVVAFVSSGNAAVHDDGQKISHGLAEVVKMVESGVAEEVVLAYIKNSPVPKPNADELISLHEAGVPKSVMMALVSKNGASSATAVASAPAESGRVLAKPVYEQPPAAAPSVVYVQPAPVYVQRDPVVVYSAPSYLPSYYDYPYYRSYYSWPAVSLGFSFGHHLFGHHGGHHGLWHHGHHGGHHSFAHHGGHGIFHHGFGGHHGGGHHGHGGGIHHAGHSRHH